jgi:hypothetical protein
LTTFLNSIREKNAVVLGGNWRTLMSYAEAKNHFETGRLNTVDKGVIETIDERKHSCEEITVTTPLNHKVKVRMKNLGDDVWDTTLVYVRQPHRVGKFKGWDHVIQAATKKAIEIADAPPSPGPVICVGDDPECKNPKINN